MLFAPFSAVGPGQVWIIYPFRKDSNGNQGVAKLLYDLGDKAKESLAIYSDISTDGKFAYFTITLGNHIAALDISDLDNVKRLDDPNEQQPIIGPHYVKISPDKKNLLVTGYFVQAGDVCSSSQYALRKPSNICIHRFLFSIPLPTTRVTGLTFSTTDPSASTDLLTLSLSSLRVVVVLVLTALSSST